MYATTVRRGPRVRSKHALRVRPLQRPRGHLGAFQGEEDPWEPIVRSPQFWIEFQNLLDRLSRALLLRPAPPDEYKRWGVGLNKNWNLWEVVNNFLKAHGIANTLPGGPYRTEASGYGIPGIPAPPQAMVDTVTHYMQVFWDRIPTKAEASNFIQARANPNPGTAGNLLNIGFFGVVPPSLALVIFDLANQRLQVNYPTLFHAFNSLDFHRRPSTGERILSGLKLFITIFGSQVAVLSFVSAAVPAFVGTGLKVASAAATGAGIGIQATAGVSPPAIPGAAASGSFPTVPNPELVQPTAAQGVPFPGAPFPVVPNSELVEPLRWDIAGGQGVPATAPGPSATALGSVPGWLILAGLALLVLL